MKGALGPETLEGEETGEGRVMGVWGKDVAVWARVFSGVRVHQVSAIAFTDFLFFISSSRAVPVHPVSCILDLRLGWTWVLHSSTSFHCPSTEDHCETRQMGIQGKVEGPPLPHTVRRRRVEK